MTWSDARPLTTPPIEPFYFGPPESRLFGCYHRPNDGGTLRSHRPQRSPTRPCAVVLCYPMGEEYIRFHRAFRQLALQLAAAGFPALRFDFYGCGDSAGEAAQWRTGQWETDLAVAIAEARRRSGSQAVALVGLRLGATLAATVGATRDDIAAMVLWDAVLNGKAHRRELQALHASMLHRAHVLPASPGTALPRTQGHPGAASPAEVVGFPLTSALDADIAAIDLLALPSAPAPRLLLVESDPRVRQAAFAERLRHLGAAVEHVAVPHPQLWVWEEGVGKVVVPHSILQSITSWLTGVCP